MKILREILNRVNIINSVGDTSIKICDIKCNSSNINENDIFIAIAGSQVDGHDYIESAISSGATCIVHDKNLENIKDGVTYIFVKCSREAISIIASNFYSNPSTKLNLIGITGTNGKTTVSTLLYELFKKIGIRSGLISTVKIVIDQKELESNHTTPDPITMNMYLCEMVKSKIEYCFMEVSSHGIHQKRINGLKFTGGIFTNLTHDHLDYHKSFENYRDTKKSFFDNLTKDAFALTNIDDRNGKYMIQNTKALKYTYSLNSISDYKLKILDKTLDGMLLKIGDNELWTKLPGKFNAYNILSTYCVGSILGIPTQKLLEKISELNSVPGRFQFYKKNSITAIVDYAHTPDALENILKSINEINNGVNKIITVVGCGGNRDESKRPIMGEIASSLSSKVIFTSDNPRNENPDSIIEQMKRGVKSDDQKKTVSILDRKEAIKLACGLAVSNDIILIAGKGHESFQEINGVKRKFDDFDIVKEILNNKK